MAQNKNLFFARKVAPADLTDGGSFSGGTAMRYVDIAAPDTTSSISVKNLVGISVKRLDMLQHAAGDGVTTVAVTLGAGPVTFTQSNTNLFQTMTSLWTQDVAAGSSITVATVAGPAAQASTIRIYFTLIGVTD